MSFYLHLFRQSGHLYLGHGYRRQNAPRVTTARMAINTGRLTGTPFALPHWGHVLALSASTSASTRRCSARISVARSASVSETRTWMPPMALDRNGFAATVISPFNSDSIPKEPSFIWIGVASKGCETVATTTMCGVLSIFTCRPTSPLWRGLPVSTDRWLDCLDCFQFVCAYVLDRYVHSSNP